MAVARLLAELDSIPRFLAESEKLTGNADELKIAQAVSMDAKIKNLKSLSLDEATIMKQSIRAVGWQGAEVDRLSSSVDDAVRRQADASKKARRDAQQCPTWELYPTQQDWEYMSDGPTPWSLKFERAATICKKIGLTLPSEKTRGRILEALLAANNVPLERDKDFFKLLERLRDALGRLLHPDGSKHIEIFPSSPLDLPEKIFKRAYPDAGPSMREFMALGEGTKDLRRSSSAYKRAHEPLMLHLTPSPSRGETSGSTVRPTGSPMDACMAISQSLGQSSVDPLRAMACLFLGANAMQAHAPFHPSSSSPALQNISGFPMPLALQDSPNAIQDQAIQDEDKDLAERGNEMSGSGGSQCPKADGSDRQQPDINPIDADAEMRAALANRAAFKRPAGARRRRHEDTDAMRHDSKVRATKNRPGAMQQPNIDQANNISFFPDDARRTRNQFCSKWFHRTRNQLRKEGLSEVKIQQAVHDVYAAAGKVWDKHMA